ARRALTSYTHNARQILSADRTPAGWNTIEESLGLLGTVGIRRIVRKFRRRKLRPRLLQRGHEGPRLVHFIRAGKERRVAAQRVQQQALVGLRRALLECLLVEKSQ